MVSSPTPISGGVQEAGEGQQPSSESIALSPRGLADSYGSDATCSLDGFDDEESRDLVFVECPLTAQLEELTVDRDAWKATALLQAGHVASLWLEVNYLRQELALMTEVVRFAQMEGQNAKAYTQALAKEMAKLCRKPEADNKDADATSSPDKAFHVVAEICEKV